MTKNDKKHITLPAHFYAEPASEGHTLALLHLIAQEDRVAIYGHDGYEASDERHEELACLTLNAAAFQNAVISWLAWRLGIPEDSLQNLPEKLNELERCRKAVDVLLYALPDAAVFAENAERIREAQGLLDELFPEGDEQ